MIKNVGNVDKAVRIVLGILLLVFAFVGHGSMLGSLLMILGGAALLYTAYTQHCMGYKMLGISTCACCSEMENCTMESGKKHSHEKVAVKTVAKKVKAKTKKSPSKKKKKK